MTKIIFSSMIEFNYSQEYLLKRQQQDLILGEKLNETVEKQELNLEEKFNEKCKLTEKQELNKNK